MPNMKSLRSFRLASLTGHIYNVKANEPIMIADSCVSEAMASGMVPVDEADVPFNDDTSTARVEFEGDMRKSLVYMAVEAIVKENDVKEFAAGVPKAAAVGDRLGITIGDKEVRAMFQLYNTAKSEGRAITLLPQAHMALRVIEATDRNDLIAMGKEMGFEHKEVNSLAVRDLRKLLLTKLNGIAVE
jgi:hypothetical protein